MLKAVTSGDGPEFADAAGGERGEEHRFPATGAADPAARLTPRDPVPAETLHRWVSDTPALQHFTFSSKHVHVHYSLNTTERLSRLQKSPSLPGAGLPTEQNGTATLRTADTGFDMTTRGQLTSQKHLQMC